MAPFDFAPLARRYAQDERLLGFGLTNHGLGMMTVVGV